MDRKEELAHFLLLFFLSNKKERKSLNRTDSIVVVVVVVMFKKRKSLKIDLLTHRSRLSIFFPTFFGQRLASVTTQPVAAVLSSFVSSC